MEKTPRLGRPKETASTEQMLRVARLYYKDGSTKQQIAAQEHMDSRKVAWLLTQAKELGVVKITFQETVESGLEDRLRKLYPHLHRAFVIPGTPIERREQYDDFLVRAASVTADYFDELVDRHPPEKPLNVGISGGTTLYAFANMLPIKERQQVYVHATALIGQGHFAKSSGHINPIVNASILHAHCGGLRGQIEYATVSPYWPETRAQVREELERLAGMKPIREILKRMQEIDIAFAGLGVIDPGKASDIQAERISITGLLQPIVSEKKLIQEGATADLAYSVMDANGNGRPEWQFFLTAGYGSKYPGIEFYKQMVATGRKVIAIAGPDKLPAIKAALAGKAINVWVTHEDTARQLLDAR